MRQVLALKHLFMDKSRRTMSTSLQALHGYETGGIGSKKKKKKGKARALRVFACTVRYTEWVSCNEEMANARTKYNGKKIYPISSTTLLSHDAPCRNWYYSAMNMNISTVNDHDRMTLWRHCSNNITGLLHTGSTDATICTISRSKTTDRYWGFSTHLN